MCGKSGKLIVNLLYQNKIKAETLNLLMENNKLGEKSSFYKFI